MSAQEQDGSSKDGERGSGRREEDHGGPFEMIFTVISLVLIAGLLGYLTFQSLTDQTPPQFEIEASAARVAGDFKMVDVYISNGGHEAAKSLMVQGEAVGRDNETVTAEATMDWLPGHSRRRVTLVFPAEIMTSVPEIMVVGYEEP